jgi:putative ABC transport system ATP-binding protein
MIAEAVLMTDRERRMPDTVLTVDQLSKRFQSGGETVRVIDQLSFEVAAAGSMAIIGRSGSGKSTLLNMLCGLETPDSGQISMAGRHFNAMQNAPEPDSASRWAALRKQTIGVVFQEANLMPAMTLLENVRLRASLAGQTAGDELHWLEQLGVATEAHRFPDQVSGGQRQRAALAMVFAMHPAIILADEPTGSLDRQTAEDVADRLFEVQHDTGCALILATHDQALAARCPQALDLGGDHR